MVSRRKKHRKHKSSRGDSAFGAFIVGIFEVVFDVLDGFFD